MKIFGKSLFEKKRIEKLYDFAQHGILKMSENYGLDELVEYIPVDPAERRTQEELKAKKKKEAAESAAKKQPTPKELYLLKTLNTPELTINCDPVYVDSQVESLTEKLSLYGPEPKTNKKHALFGSGEPGYVMYGRREVASMIERLNNRKKMADVAEKIQEWPHTTNDAVRKLLSEQSHLTAKEATEMLPDLPADAVKEMKKYIEITHQLCGKNPVFYLIAEKQETKQVARKRDPILLAQSPFGFYWQILGAWDKEVVFLDEL